jgi:hypothetical protein
MNYSFRGLLLESALAGNTVGWLSSLGHRDVKKTITIGAGFLLMYAGFILLLLPMIISNWPLSLNLSYTPQTFGFEDGLSSVNSIHGNPMVVTSPVASGSKAIECKNGDYLRWNLATPSKTIDLTFKTYWTKFPTIADESLRVGEILGQQDIVIATLYCDQNGYRRWSLSTDIPSGRIGIVSSDVVYALETNRWYTIRMTANLNTGTYKMYMDGTELASIMDVVVPADVYVDFFKLGAESQGNSVFITYYDDVSVSFLGPSPPPNQWSVSIMSSSGGSTSLVGATNVNDNKSLTVNATQAAGYVFSKWTLDGTDYSTNSTVTLPPQLAGTTHTLHATFTSASPEFNREYIWFPLQVIGLGMILGGGYVLWPRKKRESPHSASDDSEGTERTSGFSHETEIHFQTEKKGNAGDISTC